MLTDEELSASVESKDLVVEFLGDVFGFGKGFHTSVVDDNVHLKD